MQPGTMLQAESVVWVVAPHADDEALGCGGLMATARRMQAKVYVLFLTLSGYVPIQAGLASSHDERRAEMTAALSSAGTSGSDVLFDNGKHHCYLDTVPLKDMLDWLESGSRYAFRTVQPDIVLLPSCCHTHQDHRQVAEAVWGLLRMSPLPGKPDRMFLEYEIPGMGVPGTHNFEPNVYLELSADDLTAKCMMFESYRTQLAQAPHPRSTHAIRALAAHRGVEAGYEYAEAFRLLRASLSARG